MWFRDVLGLDTVTGESVRAGTLTLRPQNQAFRLRTPWGGYVYNRPVRVLVDDGQRVESVSVVDVTRLVQVALLACAGVFTLLRWRAALQARP